MHATMLFPRLRETILHRTQDVLHKTTSITQCAVWGRIAVLIAALKLNRNTIFVLSLFRMCCWFCDLLPIPSLYICLIALQTSLLFSKEYGLLSFLKKSLASEEVDLTEQFVNNNVMNLKLSGWHQCLSFFFLVSGNPSRGALFFGEILGQGLARSQRVGEDLCQWHKSKLTFRIRLNAHVLWGDHFYILSQCQVMEHAKKKYWFMLSMGTCNSTFSPLLLYAEHVHDCVYKGKTCQMQDSGARAPY